MAQFIVTIERRITRHLRVSAPSMAAARAEVENYGRLEAWSDYPQTEGEDITRIVSIASKQEAA